MAAPMRTALDWTRTRLLPALLTALGVTMIAAGLLTYGAAEGRPAAVASPSISPGIGGPATPLPAATASPEPAPTPPASSGPTSPSPASTPSDRVATRVVIPALGIDLPVIKPPGGAETYPLCDVAMYIQELSQPGLPGATYLYAHARTGMFLPLLEESRVDDGARMIGMLVQVYTSDDRLFLYEITEVRPHQLTLDDALAARQPELWLQTSEGPKGTPEKLQVVAKPLSDGPADPAEAHPAPKPVVCG
jgi:sortase (surface protein transpeptidase)